MPAGDDQLIDLLRQHRPVGRVVVAAAADRIGEVTARHDVVLGDDVSAFQLSRLAHAGLRCEIDDIGILEARHLLAGKFEQFCNARAAFDLGLGQILDFQPAQRRHMRAVQPDDARQRGFQPPEGPATADQPLCLVIEHLEGFGFLPFETLRCFGVDAAPARNRRQDEIGFDMRSAGAGGHIQIACRVDDDVAENGLHALLRLADHALDRSILDDCRGEPAMGSELDAGFADHVVGGALERVGIECSRKADRVRHRLGVEVEETPACPALPGLRRLPELDQAVAIGRRDAKAPDLHPLDHFHADAAHGDFELVDHIVEHQHHAAGGKSADIGIAFEKRDAGAVPCG